MNYSNRVLFFPPMHSRRFVMTLIVLCHSCVKIAKFDTETKEMVYWTEKNCWPSEPVFIPRPNGESEDDGKKTPSPSPNPYCCPMQYSLPYKNMLCICVYASFFFFFTGVVLSSVINSNPGQPCYLLILDGKTFKEVGRAYVGAKLHKDMHGYFIPQP